MFSRPLVQPLSGDSWHDLRAADAEQDDDTYGAEWHLNCLAALRPDDWTVAARRGRNLLRAGRRDEAASAYATAAGLAPSPVAVADHLRATASDDEYGKRTDEAVWDRAEVELLRGALDGVVPPTGK